MHPHKAAGLDGIPSSFFEIFWDVIQYDVVSLCLAFLSEGALPRDLNKTTNCLIPKSKDLKFTSKLRSISLCNALYKLMAKVLTIG